MRVRTISLSSRAFTLIELLLTLTIILLLVSLLLPALNRGHQKVKVIRCTSNLHQAGLGFISFAHGHDDKFPTQVSTNSGGSAEFVDAGNAVQGDFYFSYKHFLPLASELDTPKLLVCPTDLRSPATNFASLNNSNLSYFVAANPQYGNADSVLTGDRNLEPMSNTIARLGPRRPLRWTGEMHQYRGNVLFADGHVQQVGDLLSLRNTPGAPLTSLIMPTLPPAPPPEQPGQGGGGGGTAPAISGGNLTANFATTNYNFGATNGMLTNLDIHSGPRNTPRSAFVVPGPGGNPPLPEPRSASPARVPGAASNNAPAVANADSTGEQQLESAHENLVHTGKALVKQGSRLAYGMPWWFILMLLILTLWVLKRVHERSLRAQKKTSPRPSFFFSKGS